MKNILCKKCNKPMKYISDELFDKVTDILDTHTTKALSLCYPHFFRICPECGATLLSNQLECKAPPKKARKIINDILTSPLLEIDTEYIVRASEIFGYTAEVNGDYELQSYGYRSACDNLMALIEIYLNEHMRIGAEKTGKETKLLMADDFRIVKNAVNYLEYLRKLTVGTAFAHMKENSVTNYLIFLRTMIELGYLEETDKYLQMTVGAEEFPEEYEAPIKSLVEYHALWTKHSAQIKEIEQTTQIKNPLAEFTTPFTD